ncbi:TIGR01621 family pseudouridine synthase [Psychrosphaera sp. 1_MG-2023]|uniref:TIGR01621 family pseudouridine synthase n=1 Tax=Psychrosphaera sp. 1_MG-2023 TaxID=3062643 RepID=UPI0026E161A5|nr:TIGR01621 family pseudouridine synthase [Psychrosphaera sp. 1_MG-2023]MDO6720044.1 TIGR01621 family pseudouridine synthase [Psychrosphaera sp. 1_MG-2023]
MQTSNEHLNTIDVVYSHDDFYVAVKPHNVNFHDEGDTGNGFFNRLKTQCNEVLFPVHRLDKLTSGLVIVARTKTAAQWFQQAFEQNQIEKLYLACSGHKPKKKQGSVIGDMAKSRNSAWKLLKTTLNPAVTKFFSWGDETQSRAIRWFLIKPESGKTHQIRVALKSIGAPVLGDTLYSGAEAERGYLHAFSLRFDYQGTPVELTQMPSTGEYFLTMPQTVLTALTSGFDLKWPKSKSFQKPTNVATGSGGSVLKQNQIENKI